MHQAQSPKAIPGLDRSKQNKTQRVHVGVWYMLRAQRGSHIPTLRAKSIPYSYMDPLGKASSRSSFSGWLWRCFRRLIILAKMLEGLRWLAEHLASPPQASKGIGVCNDVFACPFALVCERPSPSVISSCPGFKVAAPMRRRSRTRSRCRKVQIEDGTEP